MNSAARPHRYFRFVKLRDIGAYLALGWYFDGSMPMHMPHGAYGVLLDWLCDCPMVMVTSGNHYGGAVAHGWFIVIIK